jgi:hypothetical protein
MFLREEAAKPGPQAQGNVECKKNNNLCKNLWVRRRGKIVWVGEDNSSKPSINRVIQRQRERAARDFVGLAG